MSKFPLGLLVYLVFLPLVACQNAGKRSELSGRNNSDLSPAATTPSNRAQDNIQINGVFVPTRRLNIKSEFNGRAENLSVVQGQAVAKQTPLFRVEDDQLPEQLDFLRGQLRSEEAQLQQEMSSAELEEPEAIQTESVNEISVEAPIDAYPSYREPTFSRLASVVPFTSEDAGGIWPGIDPRVIARSHDSEDAGGVWPSYGAREMVNGEGPLSIWPAYFAAASVPLPASSMEYTRVQNEILTQPPPVELASEVEEPEIAASSEEEGYLSLQQARVDRIRAEIAILEHESASRDVVSPVDGRIHELVVSEGSEVRAGDLLFEVYQVNPIEFSFLVPKDQLGNLELGMKVKGRLSDGSGLTFEGEISYIGAELNADQENAEVRAQLDNSDDALKVGMKAVAEIELGSGFVFNNPAD